MVVRDRVDAITDQWRTQRPDLDPTPMGVVGRISRAAHFLERGLGEYFGSRGLQRWEFDVLATLRRSGRPYQLTAGQLVQEMMVTSGAVTNRIDRLVERGLVTRETDPDNRRSVLITLTDAGLGLVDEVVVGHLGNEDRLLSPLTAREREQLAALLRKLLIGFEDGQ